MCGIAGIWNFDGQPVDEALLRTMAGTLAHRGPDGEGIWCQGPLGLAHRRLAILDLSPRGHQPMPSPDQRDWIVFNGEIYNYLELRAELAALGHSFQTGTDTEVILAAYRQWGRDCTQRFNGMWAFALWDGARQELFCSRDRFGIKPFYYIHGPRGFAFASEAKALLQHPDADRSVDEASLYLFLRTGRSHQQGRSFWQQLHLLEPGHHLIVSPQGLEQPRYWQIENRPLLEDSDQELAERFREIFTSSVRLRFRSDVPVGTCLSGGLDSSAIVCVARRLRDQLPENIYDQESFSACYDEAEADERPFIEKVIAATGAHRNYIFPNASGFLKDLEHLVYAQDEPIPTLSMYSQWSVMKLVGRSQVKVLLDGQGSDEMLAGYGFNSLYWAELREQNRWGTLWQEWRAQTGTPRNLLRGMPRALAPDLLSRWEHRPQPEALLDADFIKRWHEPALARCATEQRFPERMRNLSLHLMQISLLPLLRYEDRNSMAFSIEARLPFLDYRLVEFIFQLPSKSLIRDGWSKWVLRKAMDGILPPEIQWRRDKKGFPIPQHKWFRESLAPALKEILWDARFQSRPYWNGRRAAVAFDRFLDGKDPLGGNIWPLISSELWLRRFVDRRPEPLTLGRSALLAES